ncbi:MAG: hypothetical protein KG029_18860 [Bacteroidetes bacterium]|nr:hypothetical protein [Bacteroidota bacterium]
MKITSHQDFEKSAQIINVKLHQVSSLPTVWQGGLVYLTTDNKVYYGNNSAWIPVNDTTGLISNVTGGVGITVSVLAGVATVTLVTDGSTLETVAGAGGAARIKDAGVSAAKIAANAVTTVKILDANVTTPKIADANVTTAKIANANVTTEKLADNAVTSIKITDKNISFAKIQDIPTMTVIGRVEAATGVSSAINVLTDLSAIVSAHDSLATAKAVKDYVAATLGGIGNLEGAFNANTSTNFPVGAGGTKKGDYWYVSVAGTVQTVPLNVGDVLIANKDNASTTLAADWIFLETNRDQATTTTLGVISLATQAEARAMSSTTKGLTPSNLGDVKASDAETQTGTATDRFITPANLSSRTATETRTGIAAIATTAQVQAMTDSTRFVTPAGLLTVAASNAETQTGTEPKKFVTPAGLSSRLATETNTGLIEIATTEEVSGGTDDTRAVTPAKLKVYAEGLVAAYGRFIADVGNGSATTYTVTHSLNTKNVQVEVWDNATWDTVLCDVARTTTAAITLSFAAAPSSNKYKVFIMK